jgi:thiol-disulfide isomerase/thioredoxin
MSKTIITHFENRQDFLNLLNNNKSLIILKFGASWCNPCKLIKNEVDNFFINSPNDVICGDIDIDESFDVFSYLKSKRMISGVPSLLCYKKGNNSYIPDDSVTGADKQMLHNFFVRCNRHLHDLPI